MGRGENAQNFLRTFTGRHPSEESLSLPAENEAALRQFSLERLMAYGCAHADAVELRGRVAQGEPWRDTAAALARQCLAAEGDVAPASTITRAGRLYRASALMRMSQAMMVENSADRADIFEQASKLYGEAAALSSDRSKVSIPTPSGALAGWYHDGGSSDACAIVIGGVEGWAMDFAALGSALNARSVDALLLDGPGQGESRMTNGHFLNRDWPSAYRAVVDWLMATRGKSHIGFIGNSLGGMVALRYASLDERIVACCDNGGPADTLRARANATFFRKMVSHCGDVSDDEAAEIWATIRPPVADEPISCPLLIVHGGMDPLIPDQDIDAILSRVTAPEVKLVTFSDGDHCVYNHGEDKHDLIADWTATVLNGAA